jgi:hypothetical protein
MPARRLDDRLRTTLRQPDARLSMRICKWRQIVDLMAQPHASASEGERMQAAAWLREHHAEMPERLFRELKRSLAGIDIPPALAPFLSESSSASLGQASVAATALSAGKLAEAYGTSERMGTGKDGHDTRFNGFDATPAKGAEDGRLTEGAIFFRSPGPARGKSPRRGVSVTSFDASRRGEAKIAFTLRRVPAERMETLVSGAVRPRSGDLVLARVDRILSQSRLELASGRKAALHAGDEILVAYGDRYATDQLEARVPADLGATNLVATGGLAADMVSRTSGVRPPTHITPIGLIGDSRGVPLNLRQFALERVEGRARPRVVAVLGTAMNSGKTTTARYLIAGLSRAGLRPGAAKITGTGSGGDYWVMSDAGAHRVVDFTDAGYSSTYRIPLQEVQAAAANLIAHLAEAGCGVIVLEVADGLFQEQNAELIRSEFLQDNVDGVFFAAGGSMGAAAGIAELRSAGVPILGVSGKLTASDLSIREARQFLDVPVYTKAQLGDPALAPQLVGMAQPAAPTASPTEEQALERAPARTAHEASDQVL